MTKMSFWLKLNKGKVEPAKLTPFELKQEELKKKQLKLSNLARIIALNDGKLLTAEQKQTEENERFKLEFLLSNLTIDCKIKEADFKIEAMEKIINSLKNN